MHQMKLWNNDLCLYCRKVYERSTTHLYLCPHPTMTLARDRPFHQILDWSKEVDKDPFLLELLISFWHGEEVTLDEDCPPMLHNIYQIIHDIELH